ncbi:uncharacterized protein LOC116229034 [Phasianus colchicus]|uniref:uncharacterized protein LOC116229034 n=1 Tax=Phasianus colchicus TaxID=9054 RepID=UPI00129E2410|nr:uncharacterized protein LOC116229034 [Phasianus colchicus]
MRRPPDSRRNPGPASARSGSRAAPGAGLAVARPGPFHPVPFLRATPLRVPPDRWREPSGPRRAGGGTSCALAGDYARPRAGGAAAPLPCAAPLCSSPALLRRPEGSGRPSAAALPATERPRPGGAAGLDVGAALAERDVSPTGVDAANEPFQCDPSGSGGEAGRHPRRGPCRCRHRSAGSPAGQAASLTRRERRDGGVAKYAALRIPHPAPGGRCILPAAGALPAVPRCGAGEGSAGGGGRRARAEVSARDRVRGPLGSQTARTAVSCLSSWGFSPKLC